MNEKVLKSPKDPFEKFGKMIAICAGIIVLAQLTNFVMDPVAVEKKAKEELSENFPKMSSVSKVNVMVPSEIKTKEHLTKNYLNIEFKNFEGDTEAGEFGVDLNRYYVFKVKADENGRANLNLKWHAQRFEIEKEPSTLISGNKSLGTLKRSNNDGGGASKGNESSLDLLPFRLEMSKAMESKGLQMDSGVLSFDAGVAFGDYLVGLMIAKVDSKGGWIAQNQGLSENCDLLAKEKDETLISGGVKINCSIILSDPVLIKKEAPGEVKKVVHQSVVKPISSLPLSLPLLTLLGLWGARKSGAIKVVSRTFYALGLGMNFLSHQKSKKNVNINVWR